MGQELVSRLAPRLRDLKGGGYSRAHLRKGRAFASGLHQVVADLLDALKVPYETDVRLGKGLPDADFLVNGTSVFVGRELKRGEERALADSGRDCVFVDLDRIRSDDFDHGIRLRGLGEEAGIQTIFLDDPSFNFDYAHILPRTQKCSVMHGHTSSALVEIVGRPVDGMVVDFGEAKEAVRDAVRSLDHKLFISKRYVTKGKGEAVSLKFDTVHGEFQIRAPRSTTVLLDGEATVENLAREVLARISPRMPENVTAVGVYVYEGLNKGSHLLAQIHSGQVERRRRRR